MLIQSHEENTIRVLPALPTLWENGYIKGVKARGGLTLDIFWNNNKLDKVIIKSKFNSNFNMVYQDRVIPIEIRKGETYIYNPSKNEDITKRNKSS